MKAYLKKLVAKLFCKTNVFQFYILLIISFSFIQIVCAKEKMPETDELFYVAPAGLQQRGLTVTIVSHDKAILKWQNIKQASHFVVQHSKDGIKYTDAAVIFTPESEANTIRQFSYADKINADNKLVYYRLKTIDDNGKVRYSEIIVVSLKKGKTKLI
ncbi:MAG TPA: hypothetical protein VMT76_05190 [Puia sp.]|nr:hypothetical protein [Puia sp.]